MNINIAKPFLPPIAEYQQYIQGIWERGWLTNHGPLVNELELRLKDHLGLDHLLYVSNGTIALQIAIKALGLSGEIITTPFSYVATTSTISWEGLEPVMVDILPDTLNIDPTGIEAAITSRTTAILAAHVYGNACDVVEIERIARRRGLKVIYDGAHAFGTKCAGRSLFSFGDVSTASFHATKVFHTIEGGAVISRDPDVLRRMALMRNFGHTAPNEFEGVGINGKNSEFHAAMGLCNLKYIDGVLQVRQTVSGRYDARLKGLPIQRQTIAKDCEYNYAFYPVLFESEAVVLAVIELLNRNHVFPRRYFYPSLSSLSYVKGPFSTPVADGVARRVLCLPLYHSLSEDEVDMICTLVHRAITY